MEVRCIKCNRKLAEGEFINLSIKCSRCGTLNNLRAIEHLNLNYEVINDKPNHTVARWKT